MTFSIVARDPDTGQLGLAVQSRAFGVGRIINHLQGGVGAVATQATVLPAHGARTLAGMADGMTPDDALAASLDADDDAQRRQVIAIDARGRTAGHTGTGCIAAAGHRRGTDWVVAGNILASDDVLEAMVVTAESGVGDSLATRLLAVLDAAQAAGGDLRGRQSASLLVVAPEHTGDPLVDRLVDVRVDDSTAPLVELRRLVGIAGSHHALERAERLLADGHGAEAAALHAATLERMDDDPEFVIWTALSLVEADRPVQARDLVARLHGRSDHDRWREFSDRLAAAGMVPRHLVDTWW